MKEQILEAWDRQAAIMNDLAALVTEENRGARPAAGSWPLDEQLAHVHEVRNWWLGKIAPDIQAGLGQALQEEGGEWRPIADLGEIRRQLEISGAAVRQAAERGLGAAGKFGPYDNAIIFLNHMIWHEGYHAGLIITALREAGAEPSEEWQESHIWERFRGPEEW
ncbi:MAG TPA: hypothetical protein DCQ94_06225 [Nitrospira sp.]|nr:hypothetical protein [Nitrospira sp.]